jgi:hypothetical protein
MTVSGIGKTGVDEKALHQHRFATSASAAV